MRVDEMRTLVATHAASRFFVKRASAAAPIALGLGYQLPSMAHNAMQKYHDIQQQLYQSAHQQLDESVAAKHATAGAPSAMNWLGKSPMHMAGGMLAAGAIGAVGKELGSSVAGLMRDMAAKATAAIGNLGQSAARNALLKGLKKDDSVLSEADDKSLMKSYHTMQRFAPVLATDENAVRSFLRQSVMSGNGPDFNTIKLLADSERAVTGEKKEH